MASKIILSLSNLRANASLRSFICPDGKQRISGTQTNEAPVKYLLSQDRSVSQILCLVTPTARKNALAHFQADILRVTPKLQLELIDAPDDGKIPDEAMAAIIKQLQKGDTVYLDSSGGTRYTVMGLLHMARIMEYKGVRLKKVVYANISEGQAHTIDDVTGLYNTLNLIGGMQELTDFGNVETLRHYYKNDITADGSTILRLLDAIEKMTDAITLCRLEQLEKAMQEYQKAMTAAQTIRNPIMQELMGVFREKFGDKVTVPWVIRWCLDHRMLTQALSIYREWMPKYLMQDSGLFTAVPALEERWKKQRDQATYQDESVFLWNQFLNLSLPSWEDKAKMKYAVRTLERLPSYLRGSGFAVTDIRRAEQVGWDFLYVQTLRNMVLHSNETAQMSEVLKSALRSRNYPVNFESISSQDIFSRLRTAVVRAEKRGK